MRGAREPIELHARHHVNPAGPDCRQQSIKGRALLACPGDAMVDELDRIVDRYQVRRMIVAFGPARDVELVKVLRSALQHDIEVHIVPNTEPPGGMGEPGTSAIVPAITNAIFAATGKRLRKLPIDSTLLRQT